MSSQKFLPWILTAVAVLAILVLNFKIGDTKVDSALVDKQIDEIQENLQAYSELDKILGTASKTFYADKPVLFLKAGGDAGVISVYSNKKNNETIQAVPSSEDIQGDFGEWTINNWHDYMVTPSSKSGHYTIQFSNDRDSEFFDVLVVVK